MRTEYTASIIYTYNIYIEYQGEMRLVFVVFVSRSPLICICIHVCVLLLILVGFFFVVMFCCVLCAKCAVNSKFEKNIRKHTANSLDTGLKGICHTINIATSNKQTVKKNFIKYRKKKK